MSLLVLPLHDCNFNLYPEGLSVLATLRHLRILVGSDKASTFFFNLSLSVRVFSPRGLIGHTK